MKQFSLVLIAALALAGCGKKPTPAEPEGKDQLKAESKQLKAKKGGEEKAVEKPSPAAVTMAFTNTLRMVFKAVPGTKVRFCIWETRVQDYAAYAADNAEVDEGWENLSARDPAFGGFKQTEAHPVVMVNWNDAQAFCEWLTKKELAGGKIKRGQKYRLPTDAEWSVAVGLGQEKGSMPEEKNWSTKDVYPWGKEWLPPKGAGNYHEYLKVDKFEHTSPVGSFAANKDGLHDMGGNVWEWCEDKHSPTSANRVLRGASWKGISANALLSSRRHDFSTPNRRDSDIGFRCVLEGGSSE